MGDLNPEIGLTSEFVKFLNVQLQETRDELQRSNVENAALRQELEVVRTRTASLATQDVDRDSVIVLRSEIGSLRQELEDARGLAATHEAEADAWRIRYEQLKPQLLETAAHDSQLLTTMRQELASMMPLESENAQSPTQFCTFLIGLPRTAATPTESCVVFKGTNLPPLSKAAIAACVGGFCFFGGFLQWCAPPSQHGFVVFPQYQYNPKPSSESESCWTRLTGWTSLAGQQREVFHVDGGNISYAGTFFCHPGPKSVKIKTLGTTETFVSALARKSYSVDTKHQKTKMKTYLPLLAKLYAEGTATVQLLGLQRVGFNDKLLSILTKAYNKRDRNAALLALSEPPQEIVKPGTQKRTIAHVDVDPGEEWESRVQWGLDAGRSGWVWDEV